MVGVIERNVGRCAQERYDLIVVGGGIYGVCAALEAGRLRRRALLLERDDFGAHTSWNSLRIVHGGLRYLQTLDLPRFFESVHERTWFLRHFPDLVQPLACLMPLYNRGLKRPMAFRAALAMNAVLSARRNEGLQPDRRLGLGSVISPGETQTIFPAVEPQGLTGGGLWFDAIMPNSQRLLMEILRWACAAGADALNYVEASSLVLENGRVAGLTATDRESGEPVTFAAPIVLNCAGPWCRDLATRFDHDVPRLMHPSLAFNLLLDRPPLAEWAVAVQPKYADARMYFLTARRDRLFAGTFHAPLLGTPTAPQVGEIHLDAFLADLNSAVPSLALGRKDVLRVHAGLLPAVKPLSADLTKRPELCDHGSRGGPRGLYSVAGVKFTTARLVAQQTLERIFPEAPASGRTLPARPAGETPLDLHHPQQLLGLGDAEAARAVRAMIEAESVLYLDDLISRRADWAATDEERSEVERKLRGIMTIESEAGRIRLSTVVRG